MDVSRFSLGVRFDFLTESVNDDYIDGIFEQICSAVPLDVVEGLMLYGGKSVRSEYDGDSVYMVVFTKGCIKNMRKLYSIINNDAVLHGMLCAREPYLQNNVLRELDGFDYFGTVASDGSVTGGIGLKHAFSNKNIMRRIVRDQKRILVVPNAFKGTFDSFEAGKIICASLRKRLPDSDITALPAADGGDGTLKAVESLILGRKRTIEVTSPYGKKIKASYYAIDGEKAVIESALASGLALCSDDELDPLKATSRGSGELILRALHEGLNNILICLGGSATNDCGIGALSALGYRFLNESGEEITTAERLDEIASIDSSGADKLIENAEFTVVCDVDNPLTGPNGATYTFGRQKGADEGSLAVLEKGMINMAELLDTFSGKPVSLSKGAGAAGGMGAAFMSILGAKYASGADTILDIADFDKKLRNAALVITGEGCIDSTSICGKAVGVIAERAASAGVPVALIAGKKGEGAESAEMKAVAAIYCDDGKDRKAALFEAANKLADEIKEKLGL